MGSDCFDLFSGIGGLSLGLSQAGWKTRVALELEEDVAAVFARNHPKAAVLCGDVRKFETAETAKAVGSVDLVCGGPPCEPFSGARHSSRAGYESKAGDTRKSLVSKAVKLALMAEPRAVLFENVPAAKSSPSWKAASKAFGRAGYSVDLFNVVASDYGAPQARRRVFLLAVRGEVELSSPPSVPTKKTVRDAISELPKPDGKDRLHVAPVHSEVVKRRFAALRAGQQDPIQHNCYKLAWDKPSNTIAAGKRHVHPSLPRQLTTREELRLQGFPDSYKFGNLPEGRVSQMAGDCVPVPLAKAWGAHVLAMIKKARVRKSGGSAAEAANPLAEWLGEWDAIVEKKDDKLVLSEFFPPPKPIRPAYPQQPQTVESLITLYKEHEEWLPAFVQKKYDGVRVQIHRDADKVTIITEEGTDVTARLGGMVEEVRKLKEKKLILDAELERWDGPNYLPREATSGYLNAKTDPDDSDVIANVFDVMLTEKDGDIHTKPTHERLKKLAALGIMQSTMEAPSLKGRLNAAPGIKVKDLEELEKVVRMVRELPGSEGVVVKQADSVYPLEKEAVNDWVKYHNATLVRGLVQGRTKVKDGGWVYQWAVLPGKEDPVETATLDGKKIVPVGDTFTTKLDLDEGDPLQVEVEQFNLTRTPKGVELTGWVPRVIGDYSGKADTVDAAAARAKKDLVLREKRVDEEGEVSYVPIERVLKQADPYMEIPDEAGKYRYVVHHHFRGRSLHSDVRIGFRPGKLLVGWTMNTQIKGAIKEPVTTLARAKALARRMDDISKINWNTGEWAEREKRGAKKPVRVEVLSERKSPEPHAWIDVEGKTKNPEPGKPPPVGGTRNFPGVFHIVDQGAVEFGAAKPWLHEYFFHGGGFNYRVFWRQLQLGKLEKARHSYSRCMECGEKVPTVDVLWADGRGRAWFCKACYPVWLKSLGGRKKAEIIGEKKIIGGNAPAKFSDLHKRVEVSKSAEPHPVTVEIRKQRDVLPPSEEQGMDEPAWLAIYPDDQTPYVLSGDAVKKQWVPPLGKSALPKAVRSQVPKEHRYWTRRTIGDSRKARDALVAAVKAKDVELDYSAPFQTRKASMLDADFVLQEQTWRGPVQIRVGPSKTLWRLLLDVGRSTAIELRMMLDPLDNEDLTLFVDSIRKGALDVSGPIKPGHYLNPTKATPSNISALDKGKAEVLSLSKDFIKVRLAGKRLKGLFTITRNNSEWLWAPGQAEPKTDSDEDVEKRAERVVDASWFVPIIKVDKEKRLVTGVVLEPGEVDAQNDTISEEVIEKACHKFLARYNDKTRLGVMHKAFGDVGLELAECWLAHEPTKMNGQKVKRGTWLMTMKVTSDARWKKVKRGEYAGFSVGGVATVRG